MRAIHIATTFILASAALAGCLDGGLDGGAQGKGRLAGRGLDAQAVGFPHDWAELALVTGGTHNHKDPLHHEALSTANFETI
ncbi:MAG TPA: hypothetical protein VI818_04195, partial [Candidatus Thermoplasmatota archaeon]|nr:hypothetical protein [Candidatus Thermoplasmatota archaeon]